MSDERSLGMEWNLTVTGCFMPWNDGPYEIRLPNNDSRWVTIFSSVEKLEESMAEQELTGYTIKVIDDGVEFVRCLQQQGVRIMLDPYVVRSENKTRWTEVH